MSDIQELPELPPSRWTRKCLRSKRMTRWFLRSEVLPMEALSRHEAVARGRVTIWLPETTMACHPVHAAVGDVGILQACRPDDRMHPAVVHRLIRGATVKGLSDLVYMGRHVLHHDLIRPQSDRLPEEYLPGTAVDVCKDVFSCPLITTRAHHLPSALSLLGATAPNYAHWLTEILPKAVLWTLMGFGSDVSLLVDVGLHPNIMRSLDLVLPPEQKVLLVPRRQAIQVDRLHHLSSPGHIPFEPRAPDGLQRSHGTFSAAALRLTVGAIKGALGLREDDPQDQVLFIRRNSGGRNVLNQPELDDFVASKGWRVIAPEKLTFDEQVRVFHRARMVIGPTGAAMANLIFARPGCRMGIMMSTHPATPYFYWHNLADSLGVSVEYILCEPEAGWPQGVHSNFTVPVDAMRRVYGA